MLIIQRIDAINLFFTETWLRASEERHVRVKSAPVHTSERNKINSKLYIVCNKLYSPSVEEVWVEEVPMDGLPYFHLANPDRFLLRCSSLLELCSLAIA